MKLFLSPIAASVYTLQREADARALRADMMKALKREDDTLRIDLGYARIVVQKGAVEVFNRQGLTQAFAKVVTEAQLSALILQKWW